MWLHISGDLAVICSGYGVKDILFNVFHNNKIWRTRPAEQIELSRCACTEQNRADHGRPLAPRQPILSSHTVVAWGWFLCDRIQVPCVTACTCSPADLILIRILVPRAPSTSLDSQSKEGLVVQHGSLDFWIQHCGCPSYGMRISVPL